MQSSASEYDVLVIGGALAGASTALRLLRAQPQLRVAVVERSFRFDRKVGEASVEVSGYFLNRVLRLGAHLQEEHLPKQGLRFWFANGSATNLEECAEMGGRYLPRVPAWQVDRAVLDERVLADAVKAGAVLYRPAKVEQVTLESGGFQKIEISVAGTSCCLKARWVVDASGMAAVLARSHGWMQPNEEHPTAALWARFRGVKSWDCPTFFNQYPAYERACHGLRNTATNHLMGQGWWAWFIPLRGGDVSVGVVLDQRIAKIPPGPALGERLKEFLKRHPAGAEMLAEAEVVEGDVHWRKNLPYCSARICGDGFFLVGDAAAFLDPFYSPGMDWIAYTTSNAVELILKERSGNNIAEDVSQCDRILRRSYQRWFEALYKDKYFYMGDFDLFKVTFYLDTGLYYQGVASQPFTRGSKALLQPTFSTPPSVPFYHFIRFYNKRLAAIGLERMRRGVWGMHNARRRLLFGGFTFSSMDSRHLFRGIAQWFWLELTEGWRTWLPRLSQMPDATPASVQHSFPGKT